MPGIARQFEPQITRTGGAPSKYRFTARCSRCHKTDTYESSKSVGDDLIKGYFKDRGWLLGRDRAYDLCSACMARSCSARTPRRNCPRLLYSALRFDDAQEFRRQVLLNS
jgi:hypothetical protein